ncbi:uncharacterized protein Z518_01537 [Rhinocladiella mackenziei CBS 650.93]|uniref:AAA-ATPase-like domain-containing protein n=1 Tax=Rhinocladiella mackenziei CBS 650.93 TaxID=1442369 RepID=A0A0D2IWS8_9EURO|nr:uncharacterized protein Z518_01537 [Rhinocladiella mackenziei CBS 650.93]KIX10454.1 hypothetical protein Z518_01537 [Rhinocladiella mackenziei CBS 650.93]
MLRYFHGFQFRESYDWLFKDLDVDKAVKAGITQPGRYLILEFDFSGPTYSHKHEECAEFLAWEINLGLSNFKYDYAEYLGDSFASATSTFSEKDPAGNLRHLINAVDLALQDIHDRGEKDHPLWDVRGIYLLADEYDACANDYIDPHEPLSWSDVEPVRTLKAFWTNVKVGEKSFYGIRNVYITGVTPLLLSGLTSGANHQENISFNAEISALCGLTRSDVLEALRLIDKNEEEVQKHIRTLEKYANGYHFCQRRSVELVFNTQTALLYLQAFKDGKEPEIMDPVNSEVPEPYLWICARAPAAVNDMQCALQRDEHGSYQKIPYKEVLDGFTPHQLNTQATGEGDISVWRSLMVYMGGLTFDSNDPSSFFKIPNLIAAKRFRSAILKRLSLYDTIGDAVHTLARTGNPMSALAGYCQLMRHHDKIEDAFLKTEEHHRGIFQTMILKNRSIDAMGEYQVKKVTTSAGFVDLLITNNQNLYTLIEFKNIQIPCLKLDGEQNIDKAEQLEAMNLTKILGLKFKDDKYRTGTIRNWIDGRGSKPGSVCKQLQSYIAGPTVQKEIVDKNFRAFVVVIVGSRQILVREMDRNGNWVGNFQLAK